MSKVTINNELFDYDGSELLLSEAVAIEQGTGLSWGEWQAGLVAGTTRGIGGFVWLVWRQNGRDVPLADILNGSVQVRLPVTVEQDGEPEGGEPGGAEA